MDYTLQQSYATKHQFFTRQLSEVDPEIASIILSEKHRQASGIAMIASENLVSKAVLEAQGSLLTNKYAEGYPGKRYYSGCEFVDKIERIAMLRAKELFGASFVNVQPHSGSQANQAVFMAMLKPHDKILSMSLDAGGHLTHGSKVNQSGKWFDVAHYNVHKNDNQNYGFIDYDAIQKLALLHRPKLIIAGCSTYPRNIDFARFRTIADSVNAYLMADIAHYAGLIACGKFNDPLPHAHVVTTTTHKTLRGARGGMVMTNDIDIAKRIDSAVFPGIQGGPLMHIIAAKAVAFGEALQPEYKKYIESVCENAKSIADVLLSRGYDLMTGGTDSHIVLVDLRSAGITGIEAEQCLNSVGIYCNKNSIPFDTQNPTITSGIRFGSPAGTARGFGKGEFETISNCIADMLDFLRESKKSTFLNDRSAVHGNTDNNSELMTAVRKIVSDLCESFPIY